MNIGNEAQNLRVQNAKPFVSVAHGQNKPNDEVWKPDMSLRTFTVASSKRNDHQLRTDYKKNKESNAYIVVKHKGNRNLTAPRSTSGIPITAHPKAVGRTGFETGMNVDIRTSAFRHLNPEGTPKKEIVNIELSHALPHGNYGTDNIISAAPASEDQNTMQLALERGMRAATKALDTKLGLNGNISMIRFKSTDVRDAKTQLLDVRRIKLERLINPLKGWHDAGNKVTAVDEYFDGQRRGVTTNEFADLQQTVYDRIMNPTGTLGSLDPKNGMDKNKAYAVVTPPTEKELRDHQYKVSTEIGNNQLVDAQTRGKGKSGQIREGVDIIGPALTDVKLGNQVYGQSARNILHDEYVQTIANTLGPNENKDAFIKRMYSGYAEKLPDDISRAYNRNRTERTLLKPESVQLLKAPDKSLAYHDMMTKTALSATKSVMDLIFGAQGGKIQGYQTRHNKINFIDLAAGHSKRVNNRSLSAERHGGHVNKKIDSREVMPKLVTRHSSPMKVEKPPI